MLKSCSVTILNGFRSIEPTQYAIPFISVISDLTFSIKLSSSTSVTVNVHPNFSAIEPTSVSFLATRWISFPEFFNCSAKLDPIDPVAPKIRYFSDMSEKYLIFGATGSIGSSLAEQLKNSGNDIHLVARNETEVGSIAEKLGCTFTVTDVLEDNFIEKVKSDITEIKGIAYCVGSIDLKPLRMVTEQDFNKCMKLNLYSAVEVIKGYQESLKKNKGSIVLFSTVAAQRGFTNHAIIASAKAAVEGLTVSLAAEFAPNIRVNCIAPSLTKSKIAEPMLKNTTIAEGIAKAHPLKRLGEGKDSASLAKFLITEDGSWVTGQIIAVDGGRSKLS